MTTVVMDIWHWTPLVTLTLLAALSSMPKEPVRAGPDRRRQPASDVLAHHPADAPAGDYRDRLHPHDGRAAHGRRSLDADRRRPGRATRYIGLYIWRVVFPKTDYGYGSAMSLVTLYLTIVICWLLYVAPGRRRARREA